jgi:hypothetical protein
VFFVRRERGARALQDRLGLAAAKAGGGGEAGGGEAAGGPVGGEHAV